MPFFTPGHPDHALPLTERDYLELVDATARKVVTGKRGHMSENTAPIIERLGISSSEWSAAAVCFRRHYRDGDIKLNKAV